MASLEFNLKTDESKLETNVPAKGVPISTRTKVDDAEPRDESGKESESPKSGKILEVEVAVDSEKLDPLHRSSGTGAPLLVQLNNRSQTQSLDAVKVSPTKNTPFGPTILDKLITKNKLQLMREAESRKDKPGSSIISLETLNPKIIDPKILRKRKMNAQRLRNPFVTKRRKKFRKKLKSQLEATKEENSNSRRTTLRNNLNDSSSAAITKKTAAIAKEANKVNPTNRLRGRLNSDPSSPSQVKKILNKTKKPNFKMTNLEALKQGSKIVRNNRYSTRSDSPVLRNGKRRKCDELVIDIYDKDKKRKKIMHDLISIKSDGLSDEQCSFVTASESDICSFLDLDTTSQNLDANDIKEELLDAVDIDDFSAANNECDDVNSNSLNLDSLRKDTSTTSDFSALVKKERASSEEVIKSISDSNLSMIQGSKADKIKAEVINHFETINQENKACLNLLEDSGVASIDSFVSKKELSSEDDQDKSEMKAGSKKSVHSVLKNESVNCKFTTHDKKEEASESHPTNGERFDVSESITCEETRSDPVSSETSESSESSVQLADSVDCESLKNDESCSFSSDSRVITQGRKIRSSSMNDSSKFDSVSFLSLQDTIVKLGEGNKNLDLDEVSFTADNSQFELFVEKTYKSDAKKRSSSDSELCNVKNINQRSFSSFDPKQTVDTTSESTDGLPDGNHVIMSNSCDEILNDDKEDNEMYEKYITEDSNSEDASCNSSQISEIVKSSDKELDSSYQPSDLKENKLSDQIEASGNDDSKLPDEATDGTIPSVDSNIIASLNETSDTPEVQAMKESILNALGLQSKSMPGKDEKPTKSKDKYTGTLKAVIKLNRSSDKKNTAGKMVFKQKDASSTATTSQNLEYRICSEIEVGTENVPLTHLKDIAINSINKKTNKAIRSQFDLSCSLDDMETGSNLQKKDETPGVPSDESTPKEDEVKKALVIPEKSSSFSIHPERLCSDVCSYCHGKFGSLDTPCHIGQIKNSDRRSKILSIEILLTKDSCLCDACFRYVDRRANCPSFKAQAPKCQRRQPLSGVLCSVQGCTQPANHSVRRKWLVKLKKSIAKQLMIDMEKIQHNQHLPFPLCSQHYYWVDYFTVCGICKKRLSRNNMYALGPEAEELNRFLQEDRIPVHLTDKLFLCKLCRYYSSLRLKYKDLSQLTQGHKTYFRSYRRKILQYHDIEVSESEEDVGEKSTEDETLDSNQGKLKRKKNKKGISEDSKKGASDEKKSIGNDEKLKSSGQGFADSIDSGRNEATTPTIDYSALAGTENVGFNNIASLLSSQNQNSSGSGGKLQVKLGNLNIGKLSSLEIGQDSRIDKNASKNSVSSQPVRPPYLPGEKELPLKADITFPSQSSNLAWERCTSTIQFDKDTKQLWQDLQRPYGNASSFLRHLVMLEKHWRSGSLILTENADPRAVKYVNSVRNRINSFETNFSSDKELKTRNKTELKQSNDSSSSSSAVVIPKSTTPVAGSQPVKTCRQNAGTEANPITIAERTTSNGSATIELVNKSSDKHDSGSDKVENKANESGRTNISITLNKTNSVNNVEMNRDKVVDSKSAENAASSNPPSTTNMNSSLNFNSPLLESLNSQSSSIPFVNIVNLTSNVNSNSSVSINPSSSSNLSFSSNVNSSVCSSPSVSLILPPNMSSALSSSLQNTLISFTSNSGTDGNSISVKPSVNQINISAPSSSVKPDVILCSNPSSKGSSSSHVNIAPKPSVSSNYKSDPSLKQQNAMKANCNTSAPVKLLQANIKSSLASSPSSSNSGNNNSSSNSGNSQFRKNVLSAISCLEAQQINSANNAKSASNTMKYPKGVSGGSNQRNLVRFPPHLIRFPSGNQKNSVPPLELIVPKSFTMQTKTIPASSAPSQMQPFVSKPKHTSRDLHMPALLKQFRTLKPKLPKFASDKPALPLGISSFTPMISDVRSLASPDIDSSSPSASTSNSMPKIPKALTITQVTQPSNLTRNVTVSLERKPNSIPAAFLGGEKPSVSVFCEVNPLNPLNPPP